MVILKKIKGSTLMETLVATVLIIVVFMMASLILNNVFGNHIKNDRHAIKNYFNELKYLYLSDQITLPYHNDYNNCEISLEIVKNEKDYILFEAINRENLKTIQYRSYDIK